MSLDAAAEIRAGRSPDAVRRAVLDRLAAAADAAPTVPATPTPGAAESPLVRRARAAAAAVKGA